MGTNATIFIKNKGGLVKIEKQYDGDILENEILDFVNSKKFVNGFSNDMQFNGIDDFSSQFVTYLKIKHSGGVKPGNTYLCGVTKEDFEFISSEDEKHLLNYCDFSYILDFDKNNLIIFKYINGVHKSIVKLIQNKNSKVENI